MRTKNYLIVTASIGSGHMRAAAAIGEEINRLCPSANVKIIDFMSYKTAFFNGLLKTIYLKMLDFVPNLYDFLYKFTGGRTTGFSVQRILSMVMKRDMERLVQQYTPDAVICTHPFPAGAVSYLKKKARYEFLFATVMTDYSVHQMWVYDNVDVYFVASEDMKQDLEDLGFAEKKVFATGIPVMADFRSDISQIQARKAIGLSFSEPILLLMGGGLGLGGVDDALCQIEKLEADLQVLVVAGNNKALFERVKRKSANSKHKIKAIGYTDKIRLLMGVSDILITKPGALTISEAMAAGIPLVLHEPIPGPESDNAAFAVTQGVAVWVKKEESLTDKLAQLLRDKDALSRMKAGAYSCRKPQSATDIVKDIFFLLQ